MKAIPQKSKSDRSSSSRSLAELLAPFRSGWVALSSDEQEIVASDETLHETRERATRTKTGNEVIFRQSDSSEPGISSFFPVKLPYRPEPSTPGAAHPDRTSVLRPRIRVRLFHKNRFIDRLALVDSRSG